MEWNGTYGGMSTVFLAPVRGLNACPLQSAYSTHVSFHTLWCGVATSVLLAPRWDASPEALRPPHWSAPRCFFDRGSGAPWGWHWLHNEGSVDADMNPNYKNQNQKHFRKARWPFQAQHHKLTDLLTAFHVILKKSANLVSDFIWNIHHWM